MIALVLMGSLPAAPVFAQSEPVIMPPPGQVWTVYCTVTAVVNDNYATVTIIADIGNRGPDPEFPFQVRVPDDAFVTGLKITRDGEVFEAEIKGREAARQDYDEWKAQQQTGGLVEKTRGSSVYSFLVNVAEFTSVRAELTYETYLAAEEDVFTLPLEAPVSGFGQDLGARFDVLILHSDGVLAAWGTPQAHVLEETEGTRLAYEVGPRASDAATLFAASYIIAATPNAGSIVVGIKDGVGYFAHRFRPQPDAERLPLDLVLVLDVSGSMTGLKIEQLRDAATQAIQLLDEGDRLQTVFFSGDALSPWPGLRPATADTRREAADAIADVLAAGGTNIEAGMERGLAAYDPAPASEDPARMPILVFLTDGLPTAGNTDRGALVELARGAREDGVRVFALAFGADADWSLVHALAEAGGGMALRVAEGEGAEVDLTRFIAALTTPVLRDVRIEYADGIEALERSTDVLFAGSELLVVGTFDPDLDEISGTVTARGPDGERTYTFADDVGGARGGSFLPRLVAYQEIRHLQQLISAEGARDDWVERVVEVALGHGFVTDHTSLVVTLDPREVREVWAVAESSQEMDGWSVSREAAGAPSGWSSATGGGSGGSMSQASDQGGPTPFEGEETDATPGAGLLAALIAIAGVALATRARRP